MKKYLLGLFVGLVGFINFGYCDQVLPTSTWDGNHLYNGIFDYYSEELYFNSQTKVTFNYQNLAFVCFKKKFNGGSAGNGQFSLNGTDWYNVFQHEIGCVSADSEVYFIGGEITFFYFLYGDGYVPNIMTKGECQVQYNLIPVENVDQHYCETNDLCPEQNECTGSGGNLTGLNRSALFINNIQHSSAPLINITIPEEFNWDYTSDEEEFNLSVEGYNVDTEYIDGIIRTQNYKPTSEDFTQLVGMLAPYSKYLLFLLFIFIIWAWIKKPFKSKKL